LLGYKALTKTPSGSFGLLRTRGLTPIAICDIQLADCYMTVAEKIRYLRSVEGQLRGLGREMTQKEVVAAIQKELNRSLSQPYLSQLESGHRKHLTNTSRLLLAKFFKVHPGYLVDDPEGFQTELITDLSRQEDKLDLWLIQGAERFHADTPLAEALLKLARHDDTRKCVLLLSAILDTPGLVERLSDVLSPKEGARHELA
jgi:transcriptional regulator with XRE-family HTH domain